MGLCYFYGCHIPQQKITVLRARWTQINVVSQIKSEITKCILHKLG